MVRRKLSINQTSSRGHMHGGGNRQTGRKKSDGG